MSVNAAAADPSEPMNPVRMYAALTATLEREVGPERLGRLFGQLRAAASPEPFALADDPAVQAMMRRLGVAASTAKPAAAGKCAEELARRFAEAAQRSVVHTSLALRMFAAGLPGYLEPPVCGPTPRCRDCGLTKDCEFHNAPPNPLQDRTPPAKRLLRDGAAALSDEDLLAILSGGMTVDERDRQWARGLLRRYGTLRALFAASAAELAGLRDTTPTQAARLAAAAALQERRQAARKVAGPQIRNSQDLYDLYHTELRDRAQEVLLVVLLDRKHRVQGDAVVAQGTLTKVLTHPREVFAPAIRTGAARIVVMHNHPSGDPTPSGDDDRLVKRLHEVGVALEIPLLDALVIGEGGYHSYVDEGEMARPREQPGLIATEADPDGEAEVSEPPYCFDKA